MRQRVSIGKYQANHNLRGYDHDGNKYQVISNVMQQEKSRDGGFPYEWSFVNTSPMISQGKTENMIFKIRNKVIVNTNGEITYPLVKYGQHVKDEMMSSIGAFWG